MNRIIFFALLIFFTQCGSNHDATPSPTLNTTKFEVHDLLPTASYLEDLDQLVDSILVNHPQPYEFITKENFDNLVKKKKESITEETTISEFVWLCKSVVAAVGCVHTSLSIESILNLNPSRFFPMTARYIDGKLYVIDPLSNGKKVKVGTEIHSINGLEVGDLRNKIRTTISSDGYNQNFQNLYTNSYFSVYCAFQLGFPKAYQVVINDDNNKPQRIELKPSVPNKSKGNDESNSKNNLCFEVDAANSLGIVSIRSFVYYNENFAEFESFIDSSFAKLHALNLKHLVIDLRNNGGGDPFCASYLLQHLSDQPFRYYKKGSTEWYADLEKMIPLHENRFIGQPFILINGACASTSGHLSALIKALDVGVLIGQETGATYSCNAKQKTVLLKHSKLFTSLATKTYQVDVEGFKKNEGIQPDYPIAPSLSDILENKDLEMEKVLDLINNK